MEIKKVSNLNKTELEEVASIHLSVLTESFINNFGKKFIKIVYKNILTSSETIFLAAYEYGNIVGFALAVTDYSNFTKHSIGKNILSGGTIILLNSITKPSVFFKLITSLPKILLSNTSHRAELQFIAVKPVLQGKGTGEKMLQQLKIELDKLGINKYFVGTKANNTRSNNFYIKNGFTFSHKERYFGDTLIYYTSQN